MIARAMFVSKAVIVLALAMVVAVAGGQSSEPVQADSPRFEVTFSRTISPEPYTGRVYVVASASSYQTPVESFCSFAPEVLFGQDVTDWHPGEVLSMDSDTCLGYPGPLADLPKGRYYVQAVLDLNGRAQNVIAAPGNAISDVVVWRNDPKEPCVVSLDISKKLPPLALTDTRFTKYVRLMSPRLSRFHGRYVHMYAGVSLPPSYYAQPERRFPTIYIVPGFGGMITEEWYLGMMRATAQEVGFEAVVVFLDADCATGHHVFADSANNGPCGTALVEELIPYLQQRFRLLPDASARFLTGVSSGGWSSLWLQITYPLSFGGVWSISPDPVDFSEFMVVDIYDPQTNMLHDHDGESRHFSRSGMFGPAIVLRDFVLAEEVLGRGGQFHSFDAVFSPRGPDGRVVPLWNRHTGRIDSAVAEYWKRYDIRMIIEENWEALAPQLRGKLHLFCGDRDDFYLERAFFILRDTLEELGSDASIQVLRGVGHATPPQLWLWVLEQMRAQFERHHPQDATEDAGVVRQSVHAARAA